MATSLNTPQNPRSLPRAVTALMWFSAAAALAAAPMVALQVGWGLPSASHIQSYHPDEQNITYSLRNMRPAQFDFNPRFFGNPTFYTYQVGALAFAATLTGSLPREMSQEYWLSHPETVARFYLLGRALSLVYALLSVVLLFVLAKAVTGRALPAALAAAIFASLPVTAVHSHYMTVNSSAVFWSLAALIFAVKLADSPSWKHYICAGLCAGLAASTKLNNLFLPLAILAAHLAAADGAWRRRLLSKKLWACAALTLAAFAITSPYYLLSFDSVRSNPHNQMNLAALTDFSTSAVKILSDFWNHLSASCGWVMAVILFAALPAALAFGPRRRLAPLFAVAAPLMLVAAKSGWWAFPSRMWPLFALLAVMVVSVPWPRFPSGLRAAAGVALALSFASSAIWNTAYLQLMSGAHVRNQSSTWIEQSIPENSAIIVLDTPYYDDPDIVYENALHPEFVRGKRYRIVNLTGSLDSLRNSEGQWFVVPQRLKAALEERDISLEARAAAEGFSPSVTFSRRFTAFGWEIRNWIPADMVQNYPVYVFTRAAPASGT